MKTIKYYLVKYKIDEYKYYIIVFILVTAVLIIINNTKQTIEPPIQQETLMTQETTVEETNIKIDIKGEVINPGIYELKTGSRVIDAINMAGGLTQTSDTSVINLSKILNDQDVIIIYAKEEIKSMTSGETSVKIIEQECICPQITNNACIEDTITNNTETNLISLNKATLEQLMTLSGIGEVKAQAIITYRNENNGFKTIEELLEVSGIGNATFEKIKNNITL